MGSEINPVTYERMYHETRMTLLQYIVRRCMYIGTFYTRENDSNKQKIAQAGPRAFTEKCLDQHQINWYTQSAEIFFPRVKEIFVDKRDEDLYTHIDNAEGKKIVAVVN